MRVEPGGGDGRRRGGWQCSTKLDVVVVADTSEEDEVTHKGKEKEEGEGEEEKSLRRVAEFTPAPDDRTMRRESCRFNYCPDPASCVPMGFCSSFYYVKAF